MRVCGVGGTGFLGPGNMSRGGDIFRLTAPGSAGALPMVSLEMLKLGIERVETRIFIEKAVAAKKVP